MENIWLEISYGQGNIAETTITFTPKQEFQETDR